MKKLLAILLLAGIVCHLFSNSLIMAGYEVNKKYISENLCVNRNKVKMHCNGKCHLKKQLTKENSAQNNPSGNSKETIELFFFNKVSDFKIADVFFEIKTYNHYIFSFPDSPNREIFHPPLV